MSADRARDEAAARIAARIEGESHRESHGDAPSAPPPGAGGEGPRDEDVAFCAGLDQNDTDNGKRLLRHFGADLLHVREIGWHVWSGAHWEGEGGLEAVERLAQETARRMKAEASRLNPSRADLDMIAAAEPLAGRPATELDAGQKALLLAAAEAETRLARRREGRRKFAISCGNRARTVAMIAQAAPHCTAPPAALDSDPMLFNVANGTLRFARRMAPDEECPDPDVVRLRAVVSVELRPHDRADRIAKIAPWTYDPAATCPRFDAFMARFQPNPESRLFLQTAAGRGLLGGALTQALIFLYGDGANGKSVFMEVLARMFAAYAGRLKPESITGALSQSGDKATPDFARLQGKRFVAIAELPRGEPLREGLVKTMTGGEPMPVRHLNHGFFDLLPEFIPFMSGNQLPEIGGLDRGIWRRMKFVLWPVSIPEPEQRGLPEVVGELMEEASGILNWLIAGAVIFLEQGLHDPPEVRALGDEHRSDLDPVGNFARHCIRDAPGERVQARPMYEGFVSYCRANAIPEWKEKSFSMALKRKGFRRKDDRLRQWLDVALTGVPARPDEEADRR